MARVAERNSKVKTYRSWHEIKGVLCHPRMFLLILLAFLHLLVPLFLYVLFDLPRDLPTVLHRRPHKVDNALTLRGERVPIELHKVDDTMLLEHLWSLRHDKVQGSS